MGILTASIAPQTARYPLQSSMPSLSDLLAPLLFGLAAPFGGGDATGDADSGDADWSVALQAMGPPMLPAGSGAPVSEPLQPADRWNQVRIEQHVIIRIAPGGLRGGAFLPFAANPEVRAPDRRNVKCVAVGALAGVRLMDASRLMLLTRDDRVIEARLPKICSASAFYSGFYVEPTGDGLLCARRDVIHSRSGVNCSISAMAELLGD